MTIADTDTTLVSTETHMFHFGLIIVLFVVCLLQSQLTCGEGVLCAVEHPVNASQVESNSLSFFFF